MGMIMTRATTAPFPKSGTLPSISVYSTLAITSNRPPTEAGMPKSVKHRKKVCIKEAASVPSSGSQDSHPEGLAAGNPP